MLQRYPVRVLPPPPPSSSSSSSSLSLSSWPVSPSVAPPAPRWRPMSDPRTYCTFLGCAEVVYGGDWRRSHCRSCYVGRDGDGGCSRGCGGVWAIVVVAVDGGDMVVFVDGGGTRGGLIRGLTLVVGVICTPSGALGAAGYAENN